MWAGILYAGGTIITTAILSAIQEISDGKINIKNKVNARVYPELRPELMDASTSLDKKNDIFTKECVTLMGNYRFCSKVNQIWDDMRGYKDLKIILNNILSNRTNNASIEAIRVRLKVLILSVTNIPDPTEVPDDIQIIALKELLTLVLKLYKVNAAEVFLAKCFSLHNYRALVDEYKKYCKIQIQKQKQIYLENPTSAPECTPFQNTSAITKLFNTANDYLKK